MSDEASCYLCGAPREGKSRICRDCAARFGTETLDTRSTPLSLEHESAEVLADSLEEMARRRLGEGGSRYRSQIPLPPQMREEQERAAVHRRENQQRQATVQNAERLAARREADFGKVVENCPACGSSVNQDGVQFSFCMDCGADLPAMQRPRTKRVRKPDASGVRDVRSSARQLAEVHEQARQHRHQQQQMVHGPASTETVGNPVVHAVLSFLLPGLGQLLNRQVAKGVLTMVGSFVIQALPFGAVVTTVIRVLCAVDAYRIGERRRRGESVGDTEWDLA
ncbi:MAG: hypothetical protein QM758_18675 [Armatimonas sp.]